MLVNGLPASFYWITMTMLNNMSTSTYFRCIWLIVFSPLCPPLSFHFQNACVRVCVCMCAYDRVNTFLVTLPKFCCYPAIHHYGIHCSRPVVWYNIPEYWMQSPWHRITIFNWLQMEWWIFPSLLLYVYPPSLFLGLWTICSAINPRCSEPVGFLGILVPSYAPKEVRSPS